MHASLVRRSLKTLIPPKIATPGTVSGGNAASMAAVVDFYSKLPKGPAPPSGSGIKARYFDGKNASGVPLVVAIVSLFGLGYTIDYNMHLKHHKNNHH
ncbi:ATP synthase f chain, mitochondrial precursor [Ceratobasidium sp. 392]|nr:ATP synthase f chain, mitochondrial precursor [Ceratobasidium sp. 392]